MVHPEAERDGPTRPSGELAPPPHARRRRLRASARPARRRVLAWAVHALTASGALIAVAALIAVGRGAWREAALWMLLALVIDAVDGTLARAVGVTEALPDLDGRRLDDIVDYLNYVVVPVVFLLSAGALAAPAWAALPILASAYGFSRRNAKTPDGFFLGFPSYWNVVAIYVWLLEPPVWVNTAVVAGFALLVPIPLKYVYPSQLRVLRRATSLAASLWVVCLALALVAPGRASALRLPELSLLFPAYYLVLSAWVGGLARPARRDS